MAETSLIMTNDDALEIVEFIFDNGAYIVPDCHYRRMEYFSLFDLKSFVECYEARLFFIIHDDWFMEPLEMKKINHRTEGVIYSILQKTGGPNLDFYFTGEFEKDGQQYIGTGFLGHHSKFWINKEDDYVKAPKALKDFYKSIISKFKKNAVNYKGTHQSYWASKRADELLLSGEKLLKHTFLKRVQK